jgi:hypothetical protein
MLRESIFNIDFTENNPASNTEEVKRRDRFYSQKRAEIIIKGGLSFKKLKNPKYPVCGIKDYILLDY